MVIGGKPSSAEAAPPVCREDAPGNWQLSIRRRRKRHTKRPDSIRQNRNRGRDTGRGTEQRKAGIRCRGKEERKAGIQCRGMDIRRRKTRSRNSRAQDTEGRRGELRQRRCRTQDNEGRDVRMPSGRNYQEDSRRARDQGTEERKPRNTAGNRTKKQRGAKDPRIGRRKDGT